MVRVGIRYHPRENTFLFFVRRPFPVFLNMESNVSVFNKFVFFGSRMLSLHFCPVPFLCWALDYRPPGSPYFEVTGLPHSRRFFLRIAHVPPPQCHNPHIKHPNFPGMLTILVKIPFPLSLTPLQKHVPPPHTFTSHLEYPNHRPTVPVPPPLLPLLDIEEYTTSNVFQPIYTSHSPY